MKTFIIQSLLVLVLVPTTVAGISVASSLVDGKTPEEAVHILADQIDSILGRVEQVEIQQQETASSTAELDKSIQALVVKNAQLEESNRELSGRVEEVSNRPAQVKETVIEKETTVYVPAPLIVPDPDDIPPNVNLVKLQRQWESSEYFKNGLYGTVGIEEWELARDSDSGIATIQYFVDGISIEGPRAISTGSFKMAFDTTKFSNGSHVLKIVAADKEGNSSEGSIEINIQNN